MNTRLVFGAAKGFRKMLTLATQYAQSEWPVLILGETGVGKELIARHLHQNSPRRSGPFVAVNCGAIPAGLFESELFGFERGAFSGATQSSRGLWRQANGGTLFLDEIGELDLPAQVKLLRLIDSGEVRSLGGTRTETPSVRVLAATNVDLDVAAGQGLFRQDLLERISVLTLEVPSLRERKEDIPRIARHWIEFLGGSATEEAIEALSDFEWPGNIRQLRNVLVRATLLSPFIKREVIERLIFEERRRRMGSDAGRWAQEHRWKEGSLAEIEKQAIVERLRKCHGNKKRTAKALGIAKSTLHDKIRRWERENSFSDSPPGVGLRS